MRCSCGLITAQKTPLSRSTFAWVLAGYGHTLGWALHHRRLVLSVFVTTIGLNAALFIIVPKGFVPKQDTGRLYGWFQADQGSSFQKMSRKLREAVDIIQRDSAVENVVGFTGPAAAAADRAVPVRLLFPLSRHLNGHQLIK